MPKSLMDIQAEQARERERQSNPPARRSSANNSNNNGGGVGGGSYHRSNSQGSNRGGGGPRGGGGGRRGSNNDRGKPDRSQLPLEYGCICSMKEKFGFIHCADRPSEIFFHYSEVTNVHPDDLQVDDEVEFRVGKSRDNPDKLAALEVYRLPPGKVVWEYEEHPGERYQGLVDRPLLRNTGNNRRGSGGGGNDSNADVEGLIRLLVPAEEGADKTDGGGGKGGNGEEGKTDEEVEKLVASEGPKIRFTANDYNPDNNNNGSSNANGGAAGEDSGQQQRTLKRLDSTNSTASQSNQKNRLMRGDLVEFSLFVEKRTRQTFARNIALLQSEKERARIAKEQEMLANATKEQGVVVSLKQEFGFLRSNSRRDEVYFHYSSICLPEEGDDEEHELQIGQDMEFLVVTEEIEDRNKSTTKKKTSAREVKFLPKGTVEFERQIAEGVTGMVEIVPRADSGGGNGGGGGRNAQTKERDPQSLGTLRLKTPITTKPPTIKDKEEITDVAVDTVMLHSSDAPGGLFSCKHGTAQGLWIREGDTLLFDVIYDFVDGSYYARPTKHLVPLGSPLSAEEVSTAPVPPPAVRLISLALPGRAEGTIHTIKEAYGFIHFAERPVDVHFKNFELLPDEVQEDVRRNMDLSITTTTKAEMMGFHKLSVGTEVQFDLSVQGTVMTQDKHPHRGANKRGGNKDEPHKHERENLKAQRVLILPQNTVLQTKVIALGVKAVVSKEDTNQPYAGTLDLEKELQQLTLEERHPLVMKMVDEFLKDEGRESLVFHDIQSSKEEDVITDILEYKGKGRLATAHIPQASDSNYPGRLCIRKVSEAEQEEAAAAAAAAAAASNSEETKSEDAAASEDAATSEEAGESTSEQGKDDKKVYSRSRSGSPSSGARSKSPKPRRSKSPKGRNKKKKAFQLKLQPIKTVRFDKSSLTNDAKVDIPPGTGDTVVCDVHQIRRTGKVHLENLQVLERKEFDPSDQTAAVEEPDGVGVVKEVVLASNFGFISVSDENAAKRELLFFHFANVSNPHHSNNHHIHKNKKGGIHASDAVIHKGDEVKFKIGREKNGKRVAVDIHIVNAGVVPSTADKNACRGYILVEPTDTKVGTPVKNSRSFTRSREAPPQHHNSGGRWDHVKEKDQQQKDSLASKGDGVILLLEDPSDMFAAAVEESLRSENPASANQHKQSSKEGLGKCQLHYKNGAIAVHGAGAPSTMDNSQNPRRGDLVSFVKSKGKNVKDIRVVTRAAATLVRGHLENVDKRNHKARFVATVGNETKTYAIDLREVVSCEPSQLKDKVAVEGVLHDDAIRGICRTMDLRLESKLGTGKRERPKLNLTVKKDRAGTIMAQTGMAKGPDGTTGFAAGWTKRVSRYAQASGSNQQEGANGNVTGDPEANN